MLQDKEKFASVLAAVNMHIMQIDVTFMRFHDDVGSEALAKRGFACADFARHDDALCHFVRYPQKEAKELYE
jgi:hypothetical protein